MFFLGTVDGLTSPLGSTCGLLSPLGDPGGLTSSLRGTGDLTFLVSPCGRVFPLWWFEDRLPGGCCNMEGVWVSGSSFRPG